MTDTPASLDRCARVYGSPGEHPRLRGLLRLLLPLVAVVAAAAYVLGAATRWPPLSPGGAGLVLVLLAVALAAVLRGSRVRLASFIKGARGEERVARLLATLSDSYDVFHGVATGEGAGDLDHVVVGPCGVYVIETKNWTGRIEVADGRILVGGREPDRPPLDQVARAANALRVWVRESGGEDVPVHPVVCFVADDHLAAPVGVGGVLVCGARHLRALIQERTDGALSPVAQARLATALRARLP